MKIISAYLLLLLTANIGFGVQAQTPGGASSTTSSASKTPTQSIPDVAAPESIDADEVVRIDTTLVTVPVSVTDRDGKFISGLRQEDFHVYEDGVEQPLAYFAPIEQPFTVIMLLDTSGSTRQHLPAMRAAALAFIDQLRPADRIIAITFSDQLRVLNKSMKDRDELRRAIERIDLVGGGTLLYAVVDVAITRLLNRLRGRKALILFTDGYDTNRNRLTATTLATYDTNLRNAEEADALIYPVQYGAVDSSRNISATETANNYLRDLAAVSGGRLYRADDRQKTVQAFKQIAEELRRQYSLGYHPKNSARDGKRRQIKVQVDQPGVVVRARTSYIYGTTAATPQQR